MSSNRPYVVPKDPKYPWCTGCARSRQGGWHCAWAITDLCKSGDKFRPRRR